MGNLESICLLLDVCTCTDSNIVPVVASKGNEWIAANEILEIFTGRLRLEQ